ARQVLNATGPWVDALCRLAGDNAGPRLQPTKGAHIVIKDRGFPAGFLLLHRVDGRVFFVLPWMGKTLIGTTDTFTAEAPDALKVAAEDVAFLLTGYNHYFAEPISERDVLGQFAGLRPLLRGRSEDPSSRSREFTVFTSPSGLLSVAGGKYTTYRHMAEIITNQVARRLRRHRPCRTHDLPLDGTPLEPWKAFASQEPARLANQHGLSREAATHLVNRYGRRAADVAAYVDTHPDAARPIVAGEPDLRVELLYQRDQEMAVFPQDCWLRRTRLGLFHGELLTKDAASPTNASTTR